MTTAAFCLGLILGLYLGLTWHRGARSKVNLAIDDDPRTMRKVDPGESYNGPRSGFVLVRAPRTLIQQIDSRLDMYVEEYGFTGEDQVDESDSWGRAKQKGYEWFKALSWVKSELGGK